VYKCKNAESNASDTGDGNPISGGAHKAHAQDDERGQAELIRSTLTY
jgi:hypothetical protein